MATAVRDSSLVEFGMEQDRGGGILATSGRSINVGRGLCHTNCIWPRPLCARESDRQSQRPFQIFPTNIVESFALFAVPMRGARTRWFSTIRAAPVALHSQLILSLPGNRKRREFILHARSHV